MSIFQAEAHNPDVRAEVLAHIGGFPVTNTVLTALLGTLLIVILSIWANSFSVRRPSKAQLLVEDMVRDAYNFIDGIIADKKVARQVVPTVVSIVLFVIITNLFMTLVPVLASFTWHDHGHTYPLFRVATSDFNVVFAMALSMMVFAQLYGVYKIGVLNHTAKYVPLKQLIAGITSGRAFESIIKFFVGILEMIMEFAKILSLSLRLFGNIFAGEILLAVFLSMFAILLPIPILILALLVGVIQALVFGALIAAKFAEVAEAHH